jgi:ribosomal protein S18 acetylase RimI-like enzyme
MTTAEPRSRGADEPLLRIRPATRADADVVVAMVHELCACEGESGSAFTREVFERDGCGPGAAFALLLAERGRAVVGYVQCLPAYDSGFAQRGVFVSDLYVRPAERRRGVGRALLAAAARAVQTDGGGYLWLTSRTGNRGARAFYRTLATAEETVVAFAIAGSDLDYLSDG